LIGGKMQLDIESAQAAFKEQLGDVLGMTMTEAALGVLRIANFDMEAAIRLVTTQRGIDARNCVLIGFGGAGPVHAAALARQAGIPRVVIPPAPGNVNAFGALIADSRYDFQRQFNRTLDQIDWDNLQQVLRELGQEARNSVAAEGADHVSTLTLEPSADVRYVGQGFELTVSLADLTDAGPENWRIKLKRLFDDMHQMQYKHHDPHGEIEILSVRMTALRKTEVVALHAGKKRGVGAPPITDTRMTLFPDENGAQPAAIYRRDDLLPGHRFSGPAIVEEYGSTTVIPPRSQVEIDDLENIIINLEA